MAEQQIAQLQAHIDRLLGHYERLSMENSDFRQRETELVTERAKLIEKNELAKTRVEAMIVRLKSLEQES